jgi:hypothetical protein
MFCACRYDLDLLIDIESTNYEDDGIDCLGSLFEALCKPEAMASSGWELHLKSDHYVCLTNALLNMKLDLRVSTVDSRPSPMCGSHY